MYQKQNFGQPSRPRVVASLMRYSGGLIKTERTAEYVLLAFVLVCIYVAYTVISANTITPEPQPFDGGSNPAERLQ